MLLLQVEADIVSLTEGESKREGRAVSEGWRVKEVGNSSCEGFSVSALLA